ncbi:OPT oligopeptide transporter protein-domain-containing protein [Kockiozyma suomiensis]|uniref:OPT oligopeptide transporter protein-domain-containing protein n=1 Tax=Kockiozyma suomiensis TaxID=1337062 RepID=UPI003343776C
MSDADFEEKKAAQVSVATVNSAEDNYEKEVQTEALYVDGEERAKIIHRLTAVHHNGDEEGVFDKGAEFLFDRMAVLPVEEGIEILKATVKDHLRDENFPAVDMDRIIALLKGAEHYQGGDRDAYELDIKIEAALIKYHSPYPEVRAVCDPFDEPAAEIETIRMYFLGICWVALGSFINQFFSQRQPALSITSQACQILLYFCGKFLARVLPDRGFTFYGHYYSLNPGPWSHKEQMLATLMVNVASAAAPVGSALLVLRMPMFFSLEYVRFGFMMLLNLATLFLGFGVAGIVRRFVIYPVKAVWPTVLPTLALNRALLISEKRVSINGWKISKYRFFMWVMCASFFWYFFPGYIFKALSYFNWITWIAPNNFNLAVICGSYLGLGFNPITTFDWSIINYTKPLVVPFFSILNNYIGVLMGAFIVLAMYWTNYSNTAYLPINSNSVWDNTGTKYNATRVAINNKFYEEGYKAYSPPFTSAGYILTNGAALGIHTLALAYILLTEYKMLWGACKDFYNQIRYRGRSNFESYSDPHTRMMAKYPEVPDWWYLLVLVLSFACAVAACAGYPTNTPVWALIIVIIVCTVMLIPSAIIASVTGYELGFANLIFIIIGYMLPGNGIANMILRQFGWDMDQQTESFVSDLKMGHYVKLPPRAMFRVQMLAVVVQSFMTVAILNFTIDSINNFCSLTQPDHFTCAYPRSLYSEGILYGIVGPRRMFNDLYPVVKYTFLICFVAVFPFWLLKLKFPRAMLYIHPVLLLNGLSKWGQAYNLSEYTPGLIAGFFFNFWIKRRYETWWTKYNYVLTSGLSAGLAFGGMFIFLTLQYTGTSLSWWGNRVSSAGIDGAASAAKLPVPESGYFGPSTWG